MNAQQQIDDYIDSQPPSKRDELRELHRRITETDPTCKLWFLDGRNGDGKVVTNPNIGYGVQTMRYAGGQTREFYRLGLSANTTGISVYVMGIADRKLLSQAYGRKLGKASVTGYCIKFRSVRDLEIDVLDEVIAKSLRGEWPSGS